MNGIIFLDILFGLPQYDKNHTWKAKTEISSVKLAGNPNLAQQEPEQQQYAILIHHPEAPIWNDSFALKAVGFLNRVNPKSDDSLWNESYWLHLISKTILIVHSD